MDSVNSGDVAADMLRPMNYLRFWMAADLGRALVNMVLRGLTVLAIYSLFVELVLPQTMGQWVAFAPALFLSWLVSFAWRFLVNLAAFWTPNARGIGRFAFGLVWVLSGFYMPLRLYPDWFRILCELTPFPAMVNTPIEVFLGLRDGIELIWTLLYQCMWAVILLALAHLVLQRGVRRLVIQGG
jgi:ABC-2 type transport system permease protein